VCVIGDDAETRVGSVFLHYAPEGHLRGGGHGVGFVEDDEFEGGNRGGGGGGGGYGEDLLGAWVEGSDFSCIYRGRV